MESDLGVRMLWTFSGGFLAGVFVRSLVPLPESFAIFLLILAIAFSIASSGVRDGRFRILLGIGLIAAALGVVRMNSGILKGEPIFDANIGNTIEFLGVVADEPDSRDTSVRVPVRVLALASSSAPLSATVLVILPAHTDISYGEKIRVSGVLQLPKVFDTGTGRSFDYPGYLATQGIGYELDRARLIQADGFAGSRIVAGAYLIKDAVVSGLERSLSEPQAGLAGGLTVGEKRGLGKQITQEFRTVSLVHIIVLSGYNISIVITYLFDILLFFRISRYARFSLGALVALFFAVMTGFASASLRASLMALIAISGQLSNRVYKPERALALVAFLMVAWNPYLLVFDSGFQLSFLATAGLMLFSSYFNQLYARAPHSFLIRDTLVATSSAQLSVLPLLLYESGNLSLIGMFANIMVLPVVPLAMAFSMIGALAGIIIPVAAPLLGLPAHILLSYVLAVAHILSLVPFAAVAVPVFSGWILAPMYAGLFWFARRQAEKSATPDMGVARET